MKKNKFEALVTKVEEQLKRKVKTHSGQNALSIMERYVEELSDYLEDVRLSYPNTSSVKAPAHQIMGVYDMYNDEYHCIELENDEALDVSDIVFASSFLTFLPELWLSLGKPNLRSMYLKELNKASELIIRGKDVLILTGNFDNDRYTAYDATSKLKYIVEGYKKYKPEFKAINVYSGREYNEGDYVIYIPTANFRVLTGIDINTGRIDMKMADEPWEERPFLIPKEEIVDSISEYGLNEDIFNKAICALNESFKKDKKYPHSYLMLEYRLRQLIKLIELKAPKAIVCKSYELIAKSLQELGID